MRITCLKTFHSSAGTFCLAMALCLALAAPPATSAPDDTERDMEGFDSTMVHNEKARRAVVKGKSYLEDGSLNKARKCFNEALKMNENFHEARFLLGIAECRHKNYKLAIAQFMGVYERYPKYKNLRLELARTYLAAGNCEQAGVWLKRHLETGRENKETDTLKRQIEECSNRQGN